MTRSREDRRAHIDLSDPCIEIGGHSGEFRGLLAHFLKTTFPSGRQAVLCHACSNGDCSNQKHLYWGTPSDNEADKRSAGTYKSLWQKTVDKHGFEAAMAMRTSRSANGGKGNAGKPKSAEHRRKISETLSRAKLVQEEHRSRTPEVEGRNLVP